MEISWCDNWKSINSLTKLWNNWHWLFRYWQQNSKNRFLCKKTKTYEKLGGKIIIEEILDIIYPQTCSICGKLNQKSLCNKCKNKLKKEFKYQTDNYFKNSEKNFSQHYYFFKYEDIIRNQILSYKFKEKPYIYKTITSFFRKKEKNFENLKKYDIILVVPISKCRKKERGYNQSELIAKEISKIILAKIEKDILYKIKNTKPQSTLNKEQRKENAKGAYAVKNISKIENKKILIIDDIYTTGNTVNECAKMLIEKGIKKSNISILTIAKD